MLPACLRINMEFATVRGGQTKILRDEWQFLDETNSIHPITYVYVGCDHQLDSIQYFQGLSLFHPIGRPAKSVQRGKDLYKSVLKWASQIGTRNIFEQKWQTPNHGKLRIARIPPKAPPKQK